jgi:hypothetical protein
LDTGGCGWIINPEKIPYKQKTGEINPVFMKSDKYADAQQPSPSRLAAEGHLAAGSRPEWLLLRRGVRLIQLVEESECDDPRDAYDCVDNPGGDRSLRAEDQSDQVNTYRPIKTPVDSADNNQDQDDDIQYLHSVPSYPQEIRFD